MRLIPQLKDRPAPSPVAPAPLACGVIRSPPTPSVELKGRLDASRGEAEHDTTARLRAVSAGAVQMFEDEIENSKQRREPSRAYPIGWAVKALRSVQSGFELAKKADGRGTPF